MSQTGKSLVVKIGGAVIAVARTCTFTLSAENQDANNKEDGGFQHQEPGKLSASVSVEGLVEYTDSVGQDAVRDNLIQGNHVTLKFGTDEGYSIVAVDTSGNVFEIAGDESSQFYVGRGFVVKNSSGNDGYYTVSSVNYNSTSGNTEITVNEDITDGTASGKIGVAGIAQSGEVIYDGDFVIDSIEESGEDNSRATYSAQFSSAGTVNKSKV